MIESSNIIHHYFEVVDKVRIYAQYSYWEFFVNKNLLILLFSILNRLCPSFNQYDECKWILHSAIIGDLQLWQLQKNSRCNKWLCGSKTQYHRHPKREQYAEPQTPDIKTASKHAKSFLKERHIHITAI